MGKRIRPTYTKVKGCHECSQRRVSCDRREPSCQKCLQKGLACSGLGIRYRFNHGIASRGKLVGKSASGEDLPRQTHTKLERPGTETSPPSATSSTHSGGEEADLEPLTIQRPPVDENLDPLSLWERALLNYFERNIAPNMIAVDDELNGYRTLILPAAELYSCVLKAVLACSAHHIARRHGVGHHQGALQYASRSYTEAIDELLQLCPLISTSSNNHTPSTITTLVMLICAMITGSSDFPILFKMLSASLEAINHGHLLIPFQDFLNLQMQKFKLYANPFLDANEALKTLTNTESLSQGLGCLLQCSRLHPEHSAILARASSLIQMACVLYTRRARNELDRQTSHNIVERFIVTLLNYQPTQVGWNVLVWATFIVGAESSDPSHRAFFQSTLYEYYRRTGFGNLQAALQILEEIWRSGEENWTESLPRWRVFIM